MVVFADNFGLVADYSHRAKRWTDGVCRSVDELGRADRPVFVISSNRHSVVNCLSPYVRQLLKTESPDSPTDYSQLRLKLEAEGVEQARNDMDCEHGIRHLGTPEHMPFCQLIDTAALDPAGVDPRLHWQGGSEAVILNFDYAFGEEGFFLMNEILEALGKHIHGIYIIGKAGTLVGERGDIMLPTFFIQLGPGDVYSMSNCLTEKEFNGLDDTRVHTGGPMLTAAGTFLQNREVLEYFRDRWHALGVEMEGTPYARALAQARLRRRVREEVDIGVAYYASDAPLSSDLLTTPLGAEGVGPVYAVTIAVLRNILSRGKAIAPTL